MGAQVICVASSIREGNFGKFAWQSVGDGVVRAGYDEEDAIFQTLDRSVEFPQLMLVALHDHGRRIAAAQ